MDKSQTNTSPAVRPPREWSDEQLNEFSKVELEKLYAEFPDATVRILAEQLKRRGVPWKKAKREIKDLILSGRSKPA